MGITMKNTQGRDNSMYYVSDGFNLDNDKEGPYSNMGSSHFNNTKAAYTSLISAWP